MVGVPRRRLRGWVSGVVIGVAVLASAGALVFAVAYRPGAEDSAAVTGDAPSEAGPVGGTADKDFCVAIAPLVKEANDTDRSFSGLGEPGTAARDAGIPGFQASVRDWLTRVEPVLDEHAGASGFMTRNVNRYVDDRRIYAAMLRAGPAAAEDTAAWNGQLMALGAPYEVCRKLGVWW